MRNYIKKIKTIYIDYDSKVRALEMNTEDITASTTVQKDMKTSMTTSKSQVPQQPSAGGGTTSQVTGTQQVSGQSISDLKESSHQSVSDKNMSLSAMLKPESDISLRDETQQASEELPQDLLTPLKILERLLAQSNYHKQQVRYKDYPFTAARKPPEEKKEGHADMLQSKEKQEQEQRAKEEEREAKQFKELGIRPLFQYECGETTKDRYVSCMDWNINNPDLLAVSYGELDHEVKKDNREGLLLFWTLKNPKFPERTIKVKSRITACQFSKKSPNLIAIGDYDGDVAIYDLRQGSSEVSYRY